MRIKVQKKNEIWAKSTTGAVTRNERESSKNILAMQSSVNKASPMGMQTKIMLASICGANKFCILNEWIKKVKKDGTGRRT